MSRTLKVAIVQLDVTPDPTSDRLARAEMRAVEIRVPGIAAAVER